MSSPGVSMGGQLSTLQKDIAATKQNIAQTTQQEQTTEDQAYKDYKGTIGSLADSFHKLQEEGANLKPFEAPQPQDPLKSYGATVAGLIGIVSGLTGKPMTDALNAGAAAINATRQGNTEEYNRAFDAWKENTDFAFKRLGWENEQLGNILQLANTNYNAAAGHIKALSSIAQDKALAVTYDSQGLDGVVKLYNARLNGQQALDQHNASLVDLNERKQKMDLFKEWLQKNPGATPGQKMMAYHQAIDRPTAASMGGIGSREATFLNRVVSAGKLATEDAKNIMELPITVSRGVFGGRTQGGSVLDALKEDMTNKVTSQEAQLYNNRIAGIQRNLAAIEASGLAPSGSLQHMMDNVVIKEGDTNLTKLDKMAQIRQIVTKGLEPNLDNPRLPDEQKDAIRQIIGDMELAIPFTHHDVTMLMNSRNPQASIKDYASILSPSGSVIPYKAVEYLKAHPDTRDKFDQQFGDGAAERIFGQ